jgi:hypothetical protein
VAPNSSNHLKAAAIALNLFVGCGLQPQGLQLVNDVSITEDVWLASKLDAVLIPAIY